MLKDTTQSLHIIGYQLESTSAQFLQMAGKGVNINYVQKVQALVHIGVDQEVPGLSLSGGPML